MKVTIEDVTLDDVAALADLVVRNRADMEAVDPPRREVFYTETGQRDRIARLLAACADGSGRFWTIRVDGRIAGDIGITGIERGPFQSGHLGYLVDTLHRGRGVASAAVAAAVEHAFGDMGLHRLDAGVLTTNIASQRVLEKSGFELLGLARAYLFIAGAWRDNLIYQRTGPDRPPDDPLI
ncbi:MAG TPA: GNAT family protein [Candidatus Dormibacteraeota bacterium]